MNYETGQRRISLLELLRIVEALKGEPRRVFADILRSKADANDATLIDPFKQVA